MTSQLKPLESFNVQGYEEFELRYQKIKPTTLISFTAKVGDDGLLTEEMINLILENTEIKINSEWTKLKDGNTYFPTWAESDLNFLQAIALNFVIRYLQPLFLKSKE